MYESILHVEWESLRKTKVFSVLENKIQSLSSKPKFKDLEYLSLWWNLSLVFYKQHGFYKQQIYLGFLTSTHFLYIDIDIHDIIELGSSVTCM